MRHCQIQCNFGGMDDLCKLGKEYLTALTCKLCVQFLTKFRNFWHITRLSIISRCKIIWSHKQYGFFVASPVYIAISRELLIRRTSDLRNKFRPRKALRRWSAITPQQIQHGWRPPSWKSIWRHIFAVDVQIWTKFGRRMQNRTPSTAKWLRSMPEVEIQYGGRLFFKTGSSYISAVNWDMSTTFGLLIDCDHLNAVTLTSTKQEVVFSGRGRHLEKWIWRHISAMDAPIWTKFGSLMQNNMQITTKWSRSKPEIEFQYGGRFFI